MEINLIEILKNILRINETRKTSIDILNCTDDELREILGLKETEPIPNIVNIRNKISNYLNNYIDYLLSGGFYVDEIKKITPQQISRVLPTLDNTWTENDFCIALAAQINGVNNYGYENLSRKYLECILCNESWISELRKSNKHFKIEFEFCDSIDSFEKGDSLATCQSDSSYRFILKFRMPRNDSEFLNLLSAISHELRHIKQQVIGLNEGYKDAYSELLNIVDYLKINEKDYYRANYGNLVPEKDAIHTQYQSINNLVLQTLTLFGINVNKELFDFIEMLIQRYAIFTPYRLDSDSNQKNVLEMLNKKSVKKYRRHFRFIDDVYNRNGSLKSISELTTRLCQKTVKHVSRKVILRRKIDDPETVKYLSDMIDFFTNVIKDYENYNQEDIENAKIIVQIIRNFLINTYHNIPSPINDSMEKLLNIVEHKTK